MNKQDKINFIKEWYIFKENMCKEHKYNCTECPLYESSDQWYDTEEYCYVHNCKYDFEGAYAVDIVELMENK